MFHIVDDETNVANLLKDLLSIAGYRCASFTDPVQYLHHVETTCNEQPRCLITDILMPGIDGHQLTERVRQIYPNLPVIKMSGYHEQQHYQAEPFLQKPFRPVQLLEMIDNLTKHNT